MSDIPENLELSNRGALPPQVAFLRERYPKSQWRAHGNYGELTAFWLQVHDGLRAQGRALQQATYDFREGRWKGLVDFQRGFMPQLRHYLQHLEGHHHIEDAHYFPRFRALDRRLHFGFDLLENDHEIIHGSLLTTAESARSFMQALPGAADAGSYAVDRYIDDADRLLTLLNQHLADEEDLVIPALLEHTERPLR